MFSDRELLGLAGAIHEDEAVLELIRFVQELRGRRNNFPELAESIAECDRRACEWLRGLLAAAVEV